MSYLYILLTILFTVYGQVVVKRQVLNAGQFPASSADKLSYLLQLVLNPWIISSFFAAFLAAVSWMAAMTKFELSYAYPFMSASFILVFLCSAYFFHEQITAQKVIGLALIIIGIITSSR